MIESSLSSITERWQSSSTPYRAPPWARSLACFLPLAHLLPVGLPGMAYGHCGAGGGDAESAHGHVEGKRHAFLGHALGVTTASRTCRRPCTCENGRQHTLLNTSASIEHVLAIAKFGYAFFNANNVIGAKCLSAAATTWKLRISPLSKAASGSSNGE